MSVCLFLLTPFFPILGIASRSNFVTLNIDYCKVRGFPGCTVVKNLPASAGGARDSDLILGSRRFPGVGYGNPLLYSHLGNSMDRGS